MVDIRNSGEDKMVDDVLLALAASGGTAVVAAAGTDAWSGLRQAVARWFGRGDADRERAELERLDQTATTLQTTEPAELERARSDQKASWQALFRAAFETLDGAERDQAVEWLHHVLVRYTSQGSVAAGPGSLVVGGDSRVEADNGSFAAGVINGGVRTGTPSKPDPSQG
ncbi:hypothetical protein GCM10010306_062780 [Streptomyces umbrinus]|uniref:hypothetical protein n=1 Tax=Streptomyces umbrinus TaxID=67370 RepID=UPI0019C59576|nr:hypothetical protein [Streptomyces umbrinus]GHB60630.1 hypothetical protein GCM10010306_062780 [Streptomyces umbrinus]